MSEAELIIDMKAMVGEGAVWDHREKALYWVDILGKKVHIYRTTRKTCRTINVKKLIGTVVPRKSGGLILALQDGFYFLDEKTEELTFITDPERDKPENRFNDGKCDPAGRFWAGTMALKKPEDGPRPFTGALYCLDTNLEVRKVIQGLSVSNGIIWNREGTVMYLIDTTVRQVWAYDFDCTKGIPSGRRVAIEVPKEHGAPDGMTIDADGKLWIAMWGGSKVSRWDPASGQHMMDIYIPAKNVTSCAFGGENLDELFITTARAGLDNDELERYPVSGGLFKVKPGVSGIEANMFLG